MTVGANKGGLNWMAGIDTSKLQRDADRMANIIENAVKKSKAKQQVMIDQLRARMASNNKNVMQDSLVALQSLSPEMQKQVKILASYQAELNKLNQIQSTLDQNLRKGTLSQNEYAQASAGVSVRIAETNEAVRKYSDQIRGNRALMNAEKGSIDEKRIKLQQLTAQYNALSVQERNSATIGQKKAIQIRQLDREINQLNTSLRGTARSGRFFNQIMAATVGLLSIQQAGRLVREIVNVRGEIEKLEVAFETILKSKAKADALMAEIIGIATTTPFKLTEVADATKQLLAYGFAQEEITKQLLAVGNVASGVGSTFQEVAYAYGTLKTQGRAFARDIRQFTTRGIPIVAELAKQFDVSESKINDMVSAGKIGFPEVEKAFQSMTSQGGIFFNLMEKQSQTVTGEIAKLQDRIQLMFNEIGQDNDGFIKDVIKGGRFLVDNYKTIGEAIRNLLIVYGAYRTGLIVNRALTLANGKAAVTYAGILQALELRQKALNAAMAANPWTIAFVGIGIVISALLSLSKEIEKTISVQERLNEVQKETDRQYSESKVKIENLVATIKDENKANAVRLRAYEDLKGLAPDILDGLTFEEAKTKDLTSAVYEYVTALKERVRTEGLVNEAVKLAQERQEKEVALLEAQSEAESNKSTRKLGISQAEERFTKTFYGDQVNQIDRNSKVKTLQRQLEEIAEAENRINEEIKNGFDTSEESIKKQIAYYERLQAAVGDASDLFKDYEEKIIELKKTLAPTDEPKVVRNAEYFDTIIKENQQLIKDLDKDNKNFLSLKAEFEKNIREAQKELAAFEIESAKKAGGIEKDLKADLLKELAKMEDDAFKKSFNKKEQELVDMLIQIANFKDKALEAGFTQEEADRLVGNFERQRRADISYRSETDELKKSLEKQKALYEDYENYVRQFGLQNAEKKFAGQLDITKSYLAKIKEKYKDLAQISPDQLLGVESERLEMLEDLWEAEQRRQEEIYQALLIQTEDYETKRSKLIQQFVLDQQKLEKEGRLNNARELAIQHQLDLDALDMNNIQKLEVYQRYFQEVEALSNKDAKERLKLLKAELITFMEVNKVSDAVKKDIENIIRLSESDIDRKLDERVNSIAQNLQLIAGSVGDMNGGLANSLNLFSNILRSAVQVKQSMEALKLAKDAKDSFGMLTAGFGIAGAAISGGMMIANYFRNIKAQNAELEKQAIDFQNKLIEGEIRLNKILKERAIEMAKINGQSLSTALAQIDIEKKNIEDLSKRTKGYEDYFKKFFGRSYEEMEKVFERGILAELDKQNGTNHLAFFEQWKSIREQIEGSGEAIDSMNESLRDMLLGGQEWSGIADTIIQGFQEGKRAAQDFGDDMEDIIRKSLLSSFKYRFLEQPIQELLDQLFEDAKYFDKDSPSNLSESEINEFRKTYEGIVEEYGKVFDQLQNATGIDLSNITGEASSLKNSIRRELTEQTASELAGIARSNYDLMRRHFSTAIENLHLTNKIEQNTFQTVLRLNDAIIELKTIAKNTKPSQSARDNGLGF